MDLKTILGLLLAVCFVTSYQLTEDEKFENSKALKEQVYDYLNKKFEDSHAETDVNNEENDLDSIDLNEELGDFEDITDKHDPLWKSFRIPRLRLPRVRVPRLRVPRIRIPRIRIPRIRLPRIRLPKFRKAGFKGKFGKVLKKLKKPLPILTGIGLGTIPLITDNEENQEENQEIDCSHSSKVFDKLGCDPDWKKHVGSDFHQVIHGACIKHAVCVSCSQGQPWSKRQCDTRLNTDMELSCEEALKDYGEENIDYCKFKVAKLKVLALKKEAPSSKADFCDVCVTPSGDPKNALEH